MDKWLTKYEKDSLVYQAYLLAKQAHENMQRRSGEPYIIHPLAVARMVYQWGLDDASIAAALLHDVVEDTDISLKDIEKKFGTEVSFLVDGLTKIKKIKITKKNTDEDTENLRKLVLSFSKDLRVILIKIADRYHNMKTLEHLLPERQKALSLETIEIYAPIAYRLGMQKISGELEDLAFPYLYPEEYRWLRNNIGEQYESRVYYADRIVPIIKQTLEKEGVHPLIVDSRAKRYYSLWKKLMRYDMNLERVYDLVALRIIVKTVEECYLTLGIIHKYWQPVSTRFKDYIAHPKSNGYQSLHTTVFCVDGKITEIQIKTEAMHQENELGVAAHWAYEQIKSSKEHAEKWSGVINRKELLWVEQLRNWQKKFSHQEDFLNAIKVEFFKDRVFAMTPQNDIIDLPDGATPVDFAYQIHAEIGNTCIGAKINGKIVPLDTKIRPGDVVEIMTQPRKKPSEDWLRFVKTSLAQKNIRNAARKKIGGMFAKKIVETLEFRITVEDRSGYLKEVTAIFGEMKINILSLQSQSDKQGKTAHVFLRCSLQPKAKIPKILTRIKSIPGTREVGCRITTQNA